MGAVGGAVFVATGGAGAGLTAALVSGGLSQAASDVTGQLMTNGSVNPAEVLEQGAAGAATGGIFHGAGSLAAGLRSADGDLGAICPANSFEAGTMVLLADGRHERIEEVQPGDEVLATDPTTGRTEARPVTDVIVGQGQKQLVSIGVRGSDGRGGTIVATNGHPFWLPAQHRWADAGDLRPGDLLQTAEGTFAQVSETRAWSQTARVFNLTVDGIHTFFVAAGAGDVLVHNCGPNIEPSPSNPPSRFGGVVRFGEDGRLVGPDGQYLGNPPRSQWRAETGTPLEPPVIHSVDSNRPPPGGKVKKGVWVALRILDIIHNWPR